MIWKEQNICKKGGNKNKYVLYRILATMVLKTNSYKGAKGPNSNHILMKTVKTYIIHLYTSVFPNWIHKDEKNKNL